jgi:dsRNA-specific ribonuclease
MQVNVLDESNQTIFSTRGSGNSKKAASQLAAEKALERLQSTGDGTGQSE